MPLFWRIFLLNAVVLVVATALLLGPVTVSTPVLLTEAAILTAGLAAMLIANALLVGVALAPLQRLARAMKTTDLLRPGARTPVGGHGEVAALITTFNTMLDRLEAERASSAARALTAQEAERSRIARELHDEIGQTLTAVLLDLKRVAGQAPDPVRDELHQVQETTRTSLDEIRRIARRLRPGVLEELGLTSALKSLATEFSGPALSVRHHIAAELPALGDNTELVLYRVAQESLTNAARHADATRVDLTLEPVGPAGPAAPPQSPASAPRAVELRVRDNGRGLAGAAEGAGLSGMRERALLIGAELALETAPEGGTLVRLTVPTPHRSQ
ncbi:HAMP domain-containing sensor histidine kinase [Streptomyces sp. WG-D5]